MPRLRRLSGKEVVAILVRLGFEVVRVRGSHHRLRHGKTAGCAITVPVHGNKPLPPGILREIIKEVAACIASDDLNNSFYAG